MAIYRGAGGSGDAVNDAASEVLLAITAKDAAIAAQVAAETAQAAAQTAETNAETAETNAETAAALAATFNPALYVAKANNLSDLASSSTARTNLGLAIGTNVQAYDADLTTIAGLTPTNNYAIIGNGTSWTSSALPASGVTSVTGTAPVVSSGGTTPAISMAAATTSVSGYLTSTDWNTFNGKVTVGGALGTPSSGTLTNCTFPTLNQNTTGSSATVTGNATGSTFGFNSGYGSVATAYGCRAWVNFDGTGTPAIRASGNVSSITDNGTGDYTVNFTTAMPDANYSTVASASRLSPENESFPTTVGISRSPTTSTVRLICRNYGAAALEDSSNVNVAIFR